jgi:hypothetical protein
VVFLVTDGWRLFGNDRALAEEAQEYGPSAPPVGVSSGRLTIGDPTKLQVAASTCTAELLRLASLDNNRRHQILIDRANRANVSFYPITPAGLATFDTPISEKSRPSLEEDGNRLRHRVSNLRTLAENTDGLAIVNTNDLAGGMRRIVDDVSAYYLLGYYSTNTKLDGRFRRIEVKMKTPGLEVRARSGYVAPLPSSETATAAAGSATTGVDGDRLAAALEGLARLGTNAGVFTRATADDDLMHIVVELAASRALAEPWRGGADVRVELTGADGGSSPPLSARIAPGARGVLVSTPWRGLQMPARVVVRVAAGSDGLDDALEVPLPTYAVVADAVLFRGRPAPTAPLQPVADQRFYRTERLHAEWTQTAAVDRRAARLLGRDGRPLPVPVTLTERQRDGRDVLAADVTLAPLTMGDHLLELTISRGTTTETKLVAFRVIQ